jgi:hypothetical protein
MEGPPSGARRRRPCRCGGGKAGSSTRGSTRSSSVGTHSIGGALRAHFVGGPRVSATTSCGESRRVRRTYALPTSAGSAACRAAQLPCPAHPAGSSSRTDAAAPASEKEPVVCSTRGFKRRNPLTRARRAPSRCDRRSASRASRKVSGRGEAGTTAADNVGMRGASPPSAGPSRLQHSDFCEGFLRGISARGEVAAAADGIDADAQTRRALGLALVRVGTEVLAASHPLRYASSDWIRFSPSARSPAAGRPVAPPEVPRDLIIRDFVETRRDWSALDDPANTGGQDALRLLPAPGARALPYPAPVHEVPHPPDGLPLERAVGRPIRGPIQGAVAHPRRLPFPIASVIATWPWPSNAVTGALNARANRPSATSEACGHPPRAGSHRVA